MTFFFLQRPNYSLYLYFYFFSLLWKHPKLFRKEHCTMYNVLWVLDLSSFQRIRAEEIDDSQNAKCPSLVTLHRANNLRNVVFYECISVRLIILTKKIYPSSIKLHESVSDKQLNWYITITDIYISDYENSCSFLSALIFLSPFSYTYHFFASVRASPTEADPV